MTGTIATIGSTGTAAPALTPRDKAAALILAIGSGRASTILEHLSPSEIEVLADAVSGMGSMASGERNVVIREALLHLSSIDPQAEAQALRRRAQALAAGRPKNLEIDPNRPFAFLERVELDQAVQFLKSEHPQTVAVILAHQNPSLAAKIMASFDDSLAGDVALRIATIGRTPAGMIARIEEAIRAGLTEGESASASDRDGAKDLASILNNTDAQVEESVLERLATFDAELAERVRSLMFVFEDIVSLDDRSIQKILQQVDTNSLALALKGVGEEVRDVVLRNLSERARESLLEEIDLLGAVRRTDVSEARSSVVAQIRALEAAGQIVISRGEDGDFIE